MSGDHWHGLVNLQLQHRSVDADAVPGELARGRHRSIMGIASQLCDLITTSHLWIGFAMTTVLLSGILRGNRAASLTTLRHVSTQSRLPRAKKAALTIVGCLTCNATQIPCNRDSDAFCSCKTRNVAPGSTPTVNSNWGAQQRVCRLVLPLGVRG